MSQERRQVLEMLAQGKITAEDAERLLDRLNRAGAGSGAGAGAGAGTGAGAGASAGSGDGGGAWAAAGAPEGAAGSDLETAPPKRVKYLRVVVDSSDGDKVNIRVPLGLVRAGIKLRAIMPEQAREKLEAKGVDLSALSGLDGEELIEALRELQIDVNSAQGEKVRIFCE